MIALGQALVALTLVRTSYRQSVCVSQLAPVTGLQSGLSWVLRAHHRFGAQLVRLHAMGQLVPEQIPVVLTTVDPCPLGQVWSGSGTSVIPPAAPAVSKNAIRTVSGLVMETSVA